MQVFDESFFTRDTLQPVFKCQLDARNTVPVDISQPEQLPGDLSCGVVTSVLALTAHPRKVLSQYLPGKVRCLMPREIHELLVAIKSQLVPERCRIEREPCGQIVKARTVLQLLRVGPQRDHWGTDRQRCAIAVFDQTSINRYLRGADSPQRALLA